MAPVDSSEAQMSNPVTAQGNPSTIRPPGRVQTWPLVSRLLISSGFFPPQVSPGAAPPLSFGLVSKALLPPAHPPEISQSQTLIQDERGGVDHDASIQHLRAESRDQVRPAGDGKGVGREWWWRSLWCPASRGSGAGWGRGQAGRMGEGLRAAGGGARKVEAGPGKGLTGWGWDPQGGAVTEGGGLRAGPTETRTRAGSEPDPEGEGGAEATHCGYQVLQGPAEPHTAAEAQLQVLQGGAEARGHLDRSYPGDRGLWGTSPALVASALPPGANFSLHSCPWGAPAKRTGSDQCAHTCAHAPSPHTKCAQEDGSVKGARSSAPTGG